MRCSLPGQLPERLSFTSFSETYPWVLTREATPKNGATPNCRASPAERAYCPESGSWSRSFVTHLPLSARRVNRKVQDYCLDSSESRGGASAPPPAHNFANTITPFLQSTVMVSLAPKRPSSISFASGFSICAWMARFSGRAPKMGSKPA